jgi:NAD-dependent DNA ligase
MGLGHWTEVTKVFPSLPQILAASEEELGRQVAGIGPLLAHNICHSTSLNVADFERVGLTLHSSTMAETAAAASSSSSSSSLQGETVVVTGTCAVPRAEVGARVRRAGGTMRTVLSKKHVTLLVYGERGAVAEKLEKARKWEIPVVSWEELERRMMGGKD